MNQIEFPKEFQRLVRLGKHALDEGELLKATEYFSSAYDLEQDFSVNLLLVSTLLELGEADKAFEYAKEMWHEYFKSIDYLGLYLQILLQKRLFIQATSLIESKRETANTDEQHLLDDYQEQITQTEHAYQQLEYRKVKEGIKNLQSLSAADYLTQMGEIKKIETLPTEVFESLSATFLKDEHLHQLVRSKVLEELVKIQSEQTYDFLWLDEKMYTVVPKNLLFPASAKTYQQVSSLLEEKLVNDNPSLLLDMMNEVRLHFALLFPYADEKIKNPYLWAVSYLVDYAEYNLQADARLDENEWEAIQQLKEQLQEQMQKLYFQ